MAPGVDAARVNKSARTPPERGLQVISWLRETGRKPGDALEAMISFFFNREPLPWYMRVCACA